MTAPNTASNTGPLISAEELAEALVSDRPPVLLDVRWSAGRVERDTHLAGHLPGAQFLDLDADLAGPPGSGGRHPLPDPDDLQAVWRRVGIDDGSSVVVHDGRDSSVAARAWWLLRWSGVSDVRVLDGGFDAWVRCGGPVLVGAEAAPEVGSMTVRPGGMPVMDADQAAALATGRGTLLDARAAARYRGEVEPLDPVAGHIPGAVNLPLTDLLDEQGRFRSRAELTSSFDERVGATDGIEKVAASCGSGVTACHLILAGAHVGRPMALYAGSYSGWLALGRPIAVGADPDGAGPGPAGVGPGPAGAVGRG